MRHTSLSLHLAYRLSIAELNLDVNFVRIYRDYLEDAARSRQEQADKEKVYTFQSGLNKYVTEIDELKNEMHLLKMQLAQGINGHTVYNNNDPEIKVHEDMLTRYRKYQDHFAAFRKDIEAYITTSPIQ